MKLVIGNKNYSSWSLRPWLLLKVAQIPFEEQLIPLYREDSSEKIRVFSPSGKVPVLLDDERVIWESMAICEYLAEKFPHQKLWPADPSARAWARAVSQEMHAGFSALRGAMPYNLRRKPTPIALSDEAKRDVERVQQIWGECRQRYSADGAFLFGAFSIADAMFAPVAGRFRSYALALNPVSAAYLEAIENLPEFKAWRVAALQEPWTIAASEK